MVENLVTGEVVLVSFPFTDASGARRRPALVLIDAGDDDVVVARITSQIVRGPFDVELIEWQEAGLLLPSVVRLIKLATLDKDLISRRLGVITIADAMKVCSVLDRLLGSLDFAN